jgi:hypothetical protein
MQADVYGDKELQNISKLLMICFYFVENGAYYLRLIELYSTLIPLIEKLVNCHVNDTFKKRAFYI